MQLFTARQENKEMTEQTEKEHFTEPHHTTHRSNKHMFIVTEEAALTQILKPIRPRWFFGKIPKHFDVHLILALNSKLQVEQVNSYEFLKVWDEL